MSKLLESVHTLVIDGDMPAKAIASAIGKPYSTLLRECNPYGKGAKLSAETFMAILKATGNIQPLELMARELGYKLIPIDDPCIKGAADLPSPQPMRGPEAYGDVRPRRGWPRRVLWKGINLCATYTKNLYLTL